MRPITRNLYRRRTVRKWWESDKLPEAFKIGLNVGSPLSPSYFFEDIYIPVETPNSGGMPNAPTWENVGLNFSRMCRIYKTLYSSNYLSPVWSTEDVLPEASEDTQQLGDMINDILFYNLPKYKKLIELSGFWYNPLWNVDGTELYSVLENQGVIDYTTKRAMDVMSWSSVDSTTDIKTNTYDGSLRDAQQSHTTADPTVGSDGKPTKNYSRNVGDGDDNVEERTATHHNALNGSSEYIVQASDNAFRQALSGGDRYHADKRVRQGNIGVISTVALIEEQRQALEHNLIRKFFEDINEHILIGIF